jgi:hypothetical protein
VYSGSSLLADLNFQSVSGLYKNFTRMSPSEFEFLINLVGEKFSKKDTAFRKAISFQERLALTLRFDKFYDTFLSPLHFTITRRSRNRTALQIRTTLQGTSTRNEKNGRGADGCDVSRCPSTPAQAVTISLL